MSCKICGNPLKGDERFCNICGAENEDAVTPVETGEITPEPPLEEEKEGGFHIDDSEFVWNIYEFPKPKKTDDVDFLWEKQKREAEEEKKALDQGDDASEADDSESKTEAEAAPIYVNIYRSKEIPKKGEDHTYRSSELVFELVDEKAEKKQAMRQSATEEDEVGAVPGVSASEERMLSQLETAENRNDESGRETGKAETRRSAAGGRAEARGSQELPDDTQQLVDNLYDYHDEEEELSEDYESLEAFLFGHEAFKNIAAKPARRPSPPKRQVSPPSAPPEPVSASVREPDSGAELKIPPEVFVALEEEVPAAIELFSADQPETPVERMETPVNQRQIAVERLSVQGEQPEQPPAEVKPEPVWPEDTTFVPEPSPGMQWKTYREIPIPQEERETAVGAPAAAPEPAGKTTEVISEPSFAAVTSTQAEPSEAPGTGTPEASGGSRAPTPPIQPDLPTAASPLVMAEQQQKESTEGTAGQPVEPVNPVRVPIAEPLEEKDVAIEDVERDVDPSLNNFVFTKDLTKTKPYSRRMFHGKLSGGSADNANIAGSASENDVREKPPFAADAHVKGQEAGSLSAAAAAGAMGQASGRAAESPAASGDVSAPEVSHRQTPGEEPRGSLETELFREIEADTNSRDEEVEKFFTFSKKNEEFQRLLDKEYEKIKMMNADKTVVSEGLGPKIETAASPMLNVFEGEPKRLEGFLSEDTKEKESEAEEVHRDKAGHLSEMAKARAAFFTDGERQGSDEEESGIHKKIKLLSKGASEVHVTVEVKGAEVTEVDGRGEETAFRAAEKESALVSRSSVRSDDAVETEEEDDFLTSLLKEQEKGRKAKTAATAAAAAESGTMVSESSGIKAQAFQQSPSMGSGEAERETLSKEQPLKAGQKGSEEKAPGAKTSEPEKAAPAEEPANKEDNAEYFDKSLDEIWKAQEQEREEEEAKKASKKTSPLAKGILVIIAIILIVEVVALGIKVFMQGTPAEAFVTDIQIKIIRSVSNVGDVVTSLFGKDGDLPPEDEEQEPEQKEEEAAFDISPLADKTLLIQSQFMSNYNTNIQELTGDDSLAYEAERDYFGNADINQSEVITNNILRVDEDGNPVKADASVAAAIVAYNSRWIAYVNEKDEAIFGKVMPGGSAEDFVKSYGKAGKVEKIFHRLSIGDIRHGQKGYYAWVQEVIETIENGSSDIQTKDSIYWVAEDEDGEMKIVSQIDLK